MADEERKITSLNDLAQLLEELSPSSYVSTVLRDRPYNGQPHTTNGERGRQEVHGVTMRDLQDCFVRGCFEASGLGRERWPKSLYELPWEHMSPIAVWQNMACEIEKLMGIFPNLPGHRQSSDA